MYVGREIFIAIMTKHILIILIPFLFLSSCKPDDKPEPSIINLPSHFPEPVYKWTNNKLSLEKINLGRDLFYDPILSIDSTIHCGTCHAIEHGFADHNSSVSFGVEGRAGKRNSPGLANLIWYKNFNWDGGVLNLETQPVAPIELHFEMAETMSNVLKKLNNSPKYKQDFKTAFGSSQITSAYLLKSLAQFMSKMISSNSKYDKYLRSEVMLNNFEMEGLELFKANCSSCHAGVLQTNFDFANNGLTENKNTDFGRYEITLNEEDKWKFRIPSLRNVSLTYPYMHDGSVFNLKTVIKLYSNGNDKIKDSRIPQDGFKFTAAQQDALYNFLLTLTDYQFISNPDLAPAF